MRKVIIFDFDGVIVDSLPIKGHAFMELFAEFGKAAQEFIYNYHLEHGGVSRYEKIKYFHKKYMNEDLPDALFKDYLDNFSKLVISKLTSKNCLITDSLAFIRKSNKKYRFHIASASDEKELKYICKTLDILGYFVSIHGSPTSKVENVKKIITENNYSRDSILLIGDSISDSEAARANDISFAAYNNECLKEYDYIEKMENSIF